MGPLELGARGRRGSRRELRRWRSPRLRIAMCVRDRRAGGCVIAGLGARGVCIPRMAWAHLADALFRGQPEPRGVAFAHAPLHTVAHFMGCTHTLLHSPRFIQRHE